MAQGMFSKFFSGLRRVLAYSLVAGVVLYYVGSIGVDEYSVRTDRITAGPKQVGDYVVTSEVWPPLTDWRRYVLFSNRDGRIALTAKSSDGLVRIVDENSNAMIDGADDYVEVMEGRRTYRYHGDGKVTEGEKNEVNDGKVTSRANSLIAEWNDFLRRYSSQE